MQKELIAEIKIWQIRQTADAEICARMMALTEPWITLRRTFDDSLKIVTDPAWEVYCATVDGDVVGFIIIEMRGMFKGYIRTICVGPDWRSKGIGSQLMDFAEQRIFSEAPNVFICVSSFNKGAQSLYARLGFEVVGELHDYIIAGHSEILLRKTIAPLTEFKTDKLWTTSNV
ncbi:GNAT family N-acetyltransferase [Candidatus Neomarinimicrobiota bacterium]